MLLRYQSRIKTLTVITLPRLKEEEIVIPDMPANCALVGRVDNMLYFSKRNTDIDTFPIEHAMASKEK
jgi:hypothetical protein